MIFDSSSLFFLFLCTLVVVEVGEKRVSDKDFALLSLSSSKKVGCFFLNIYIYKIGRHVVR